MEAAEQFDVRVRQRLARRESAITPVRLALPGTASQRQAEPAEFTEDNGARVFNLRHARTRVPMDVVHIADFHVRPSTRVVHEPAWVVLLDPLGDARSVVLTPTLVERHP